MVPHLLWQVRLRGRPRLILQEEMLRGREVLLRKGPSNSGHGSRGALITFLVHLDLLQQKHILHRFQDLSPATCARSRAYR